MTDWGSIILVILYALAALASLAAALATYVIYSIGLARICKKLGACRPILAWIPLVRGVVFAKASDVAILKLDGKKKNLTKQAAISLILAAILWLATMLACLISLLVAYMISDASGSFSWLIILLVAVMWIFLLAYLAVYLWYSVLLYIAFFRTSRAFVPTWASWVLLVAQVLWPQLISIVMLVMSFFPVKEDGVIEGVAVEDVAVEDAE